MLKAILVAAGVLVWTAVAFDAKAEPSVERLDSAITSRTYAHARSHLERHGFKHVPLKHYSSDYYCGGETELCRKYPEVVECAADGPCVFAFIRRADHHYFVVLTDEGLTVTGLREAWVSDLQDIRNRKLKRQHRR